MEPMTIVTSSQILRPFWSPCWMAAKAFTIDTDEQIRKKVLSAVSGTLSTTPGSAKCPGLAKRRIT